MVRVGRAKDGIQIADFYLSFGEGRKLVELISIGSRNLELKSQFLIVRIN